MRRRRDGRRPAVVGTGLDVWEIVEVAKDNDGSIVDTAAHLEIDPHLVESALHYYGSNRDAIDDWIARVHAFNEREEAKWRADHPEAAPRSRGGEIWLDDPRDA